MTTHVLELVGGAAILVAWSFAVGWLAGKRRGRLEAIAILVAAPEALGGAEGNRSQRRALARDVRKRAAKALRCS